MEAEMKKLFKGILSLAIIGCFAYGCFAADWNDEIAGTTEITGYYQQFRNFSFKTGMDEVGIYNDFAPARMVGGGFSVAQNYAEWFAIWSQLSIYGTVKQWANVGSDEAENNVRVIHNLQGIRYQTKQYGPLRFYGKGGAGFARYSLTYYDPYFFGGYVDISSTKVSLGYGGGVNVWFNKHIGLTFDASHILSGLPNLEDLYKEYKDYFGTVKFPGREKFDSGMTYTAGLTFRF
jgi:hypothetical protein